VYLRTDTIEPAFAIVTFEAPEGPAADPSIQNGSSRLLISQRFLPRSVPNRHTGHIGKQRLFQDKCPHRYRSHC
jgi:hypothetical protein